MVSRIREVAHAVYEIKAGDETQAVVALVALHCTCFDFALNANCTHVVAVREFLKRRKAREARK
jgi:hypothetical protein